MMIRIETLLRDAIGFDASSVGMHVVEAAVRARMAACGASDLNAYAARLDDAAEVDRLVAAVAVPESSFFRDPASFQYLRTFARDEWRGLVLRVLSVPCAAGEEPYSIAMTLLDAGLTPAQFSIDAVDIRVEAIAAARAGVYRPSVFRNDAAHDARKRFFDDHTLRPAVRELVRFHTGNLLDPHLLAGRKFDVVFCKNLLIYFTAEARERAQAQLERLLEDDGRLFVGSSEIGWLQATGKFTPVGAMCLRAGGVPPVGARVRGYGGAVAVAAARPPAPPNPRTPTAVPPALRTLQDARVLAGRGHLREAHAIASDWLRRHGPSDETYALLGLIAFARGADDEGRRSMERALYLNPDNVEALTFMAMERERDGDGATAARLRDRARRAEATHAG